MPSISSLFSSFRATLKLESAIVTFRRTRILLNHNSLLDDVTAPAAICVARVVGSFEDTVIVENRVFVCRFRQLFAVRDILVIFFEELIYLTFYEQLSLVLVNMRLPLL